ncbi:MAG TPA: dihydrofolate reductase family protein [Solirubrobacteraceae bacterium]|jgi:dihydrofolate reductase|nr:dihydrofolate reductase family protein [Solirubrobacteraceae bacterium]
MSKSVLDMSMSLDGFVCGPNETPDNGLGDNGERLHRWGAATAQGGVPRRPDDVDGQIMDELLGTGAVLAGRGTVDPAGWWNGDHHDGVPVFILTRTRTATDVAQWPLVTVFDDVGVAMARAKEAAGDRDVLVHGVGAAQAALSAGVLDEIQLHLVPILLGEGRRLFEGIGRELHEFELTNLIQGRGVTHLRYRVLR